MSKSDIEERARERWTPKEHPRRYGEISDYVKELCDTITALRARGRGWRLT